jgi:hypothetical protein
MLNSRHTKEFPFRAANLLFARIFSPADCDLALDRHMGAR